MWHIIQFKITILLHFNKCYKINYITQQQAIQDTLKPNTDSTILI